MYKIFKIDHKPEVKQIEHKKTLYKNRETTKNGKPLCSSHKIYCLCGTRFMFNIEYIWCNSPICGFITTIKDFYLNIKLYTKQ
jgi:hypothetical protein